MFGRHLAAEIGFTVQAVVNFPHYICDAATVQAVVNFPHYICDAAAEWPILSLMETEQSCTVAMIISEGLSRSVPGDDSIIPETAIRLQLQVSHN